MKKKIVLILILILGCAKKKDNTSGNDRSNEITAFNNLDSNITGINFSNDLIKLRLALLIYPLLAQQ